jgi:hypothetical protein
LKRLKKLFSWLSSTHAGAPWKADPVTLYIFEPPPDSSPRKYTLYFSCSRTTTASDGPSGGHSPFTHALLDAQHGFFAEGVTLDDGIAHVSRSLQGSGLESQRPIRIGPPDSIPRHFCIRPSPAGGDSRRGQCWRRRRTKAKETGGCGRASAVAGVGALGRVRASCRKRCVQVEGFGEYE